MPSLKEIYLMPFNALAAAIRVFLRNRDRTKAFVRQPRVAATLKYTMLATLVVWLVIAVLNRDNSDDRLSEAFKSLWSNPSGEAPAQAPPAQTPPADDLPPH
jgi:Flp pilus assembly pilin Flp